MSTQVIFMCGTGGVGKTTTSVAMAMAEARAGKRCVLLTIDPAQRLADALHLDMEGNIATEIPLPEDCTGQLSAMMLDAGQAFDDFSRQHTSPVTWNKLADNRYFLFAKQKMGGIQEMMAVMKMMELVDTGLYDSIVIDTPPAQNAQQFFDAPDKIQHLFSNSGLQWLTSRSTGFASMNFAKGIIAKGLNFFLGSETIGDIGDFFTLFKQSAVALEAMADRGNALLMHPNTQYWLVEVPNRRLQQLDALKESLEAKNISITGRLLNKTPIDLPAIPENGTSPEIRALMDEVRRHHPALDAEVTRQYALHLSVSEPARLESIDELWKWSLGLAAQ